MAKSFEQLARRVMSPKARAQASERARALTGEILLAEIRRQTGKSQSEVARALGIRQPSLSKLERQQDMQISTLRRLIQALGGELHITARFGDREVAVTRFDAPRKRRRVA